MMKKGPPPFVRCGAKQRRNAQRRARRCVCFGAPLIKLLHAPSCSDTVLSLVIECLLLSMCFKAFQDEFMPVHTSQIKND
jgi:hypothetical protein